MKIFVKLLLSLISWSVWGLARSLHKKYTHFDSSCYNLPIYFLEQWFFSVQGESMCSLKKTIFNILVEFYITKLLFIIKGTENKTMKSYWGRGSKCFRNTAQWTETIEKNFSLYLNKVSFLMHRLTLGGNDTEVPEWVKGANLTLGKLPSIFTMRCGYYLCMLVTLWFLEKSWKSC